MSDEANAAAAERLRALADSLEAGRVVDFNISMSRPPKTLPPKEGQSDVRRIPGPKQTWTITAVEMVTT